MNPALIPMFNSHEQEMPRFPYTFFRHWWKKIRGLKPKSSEQKVYETEWQFSTRSTTVSTNFSSVSVAKTNGVWREQIRGGVR